LSFLPRGWPRRFVLATSLSGHGVGGPFSAEIESIAEAADPVDVQEWEGARLFAWRLIEHGVYLMTTEQLRAGRRAHAFLQAADEVSPDDPDAAQRRARLLAEGQRALVDVLDSLDAAQRVRIDGEDTETEPRFTFDLPGTSGALLFRLDDGTENTTFITTPWTATALDLSTVPEPQQALELEYVPGGCDLGDVAREVRAAR
jgi:hypothetical protein